jgi:hypothetical protein
MALQVLASSPELLRVLVATRNVLFEASHHCSDYLA